MQDESVKIARLLLFLGARPEEKNSKGETAIATAEKSQNQKMTLLIHDVMEEA